MHKFWFFKEFSTLRFHDRCLTDEPGAKTGEISQWLPLLGTKIQAPKFKKSDKNKYIKCKM